jgi:hypothetical protein
LAPTATSDPYRIRSTPTCRIRRTTRAAVAGALVRSATVATSNQRWLVRGSPCATAVASTAMAWSAAGSA